MSGLHTSGSAASGSLRARIAGEIRRRGPIPFSRYMEMCLYDPGLGYYACPREQFGKAGDFCTSSDVHALFGRMLARQFEEMWRVLGSPGKINLIELGPGRGLFAGDVLDWSAKQFPDFTRSLRYALVERSEHLQERLRERLSEHIASNKAAVYDTFEQACGSAEDAIIVFGNEFFDALAVDVIDYRGAVRVGEQDGCFVEQFAAASKEELEYLDHYSVHPREGERVEVSLAGIDWIGRVAGCLRARRGFAVIIDYGYTREEQLAGRHLDTLMTYRRHTAGASPYTAPGEQDITAHVNFTALRSRAEQGELHSLGLVTQTQFLLGVGEETQFADAFSGCVLPQERVKVALQLKYLISPEAMGETFHALVLSSSEARVPLSCLKFCR